MSDSKSCAPAIQEALPAHIVGMNYFSLLFLAGGCVGSWYFSGGKIPVMAVYGLLWMYLVPPMLCRITIMCCGRPSGIVKTSSKTHSVWWLLMQYQLLFNRFPVLEEILRVIPGLYSVWLNAWGAKVDPFTFWSPGAAVMDRYHLNIERGVILGTQCLLSGHLIVKQPDGSTLLITDPITLRAGGCACNGAAWMSDTCQSNGANQSPTQTLFCSRGGQSA
jgi:hypothetical protein